MLEILLSNGRRPRLPNKPGYMETLGPATLEKNWGPSVNITRDKSGTYLYLVGGFTVDNQLNKSCGRYNIVEKTWEALPDIDLATTLNKGIAWVANRLYVFDTEKICILDTVAKTWTYTDITNPAFMMVSPGCTVVGTDIYMFGYAKDYGTYGTQLVKYDTTTGNYTFLKKWGTLPLWSSVSMVELGGKLYIGGGNPKDDKVLVEYSIDTGVFRDITLPIRYLSTNIVNTMTGIYLMGSTDTYKQVHQLSTSDGGVSQIDSEIGVLSYARVSVAVDNKAYYWQEIGTTKQFALKSYVLEKPPVDTGPGPGSLSGGTLEAGYYGDVPSSELVTGSVLAALVGLGAGTAINNSTSWLKFSLDNKTLFVAKMPLRYNLLGADLRRTGNDLLDGTTRINIDGRTYIVRALKGAAPGALLPLNTNNYVVSQTHTSEWNRLMYHVVKSPFGNASTSIAAEGITTGDWARYTETQLGTLNNYGASSFCSDLGAGNQYVTRGQGGISYARSYAAITPVNTFMGWRPVLELVNEE